MYHDQFHALLWVFDRVKLSKLLEIYLRLECKRSFSDGWSRIDFEVSIPRFCFSSIGLVGFPRNLLWLSGNNGVSDPCVPCSIVMCIFGVGKGVNLSS